jgi:hypothetical protein
LRALRQSFDLWEHLLGVGAFLLHQLVSWTLSYRLFFITHLCIQFWRHFTKRRRELWQTPQLLQIFHKQFCKELLLYLSPFLCSKLLGTVIRLGTYRLWPNKTLHRTQVHSQICHYRTILTHCLPSWPQKLSQRKCCFVYKF